MALPHPGVSDLLNRIGASTDSMFAELGDWRRPAILSLVRSADQAGYWRAYFPSFEINDPPNYLDHVRLGIGPSLSKLLDQSCHQGGVPWFKSLDTDEVWASKVLYRGGTISSVERLVEFIRYDLASVDRVEGDEIDFTVTATDVEMVDRDAQVWATGIADKQAQPIVAELDATKREWVKSELQKRVRRDEVFGIAYSSSRELEEYYEAHARLRMTVLPGADAFPDDAKFGEATFGEYLTTAMLGMARAMKHVDFVQTLATAHPDLKSIDLLTIFNEVDGTVESWGGALEIDPARMRAILDCFALEPADVPLISRFDAPTPLFIRIARDQWLYPVFGALHNPMTWMLTKLRARYPADWDRAVNAREAEFRQDLIALFPEPHFYVADGGRKVRSGGTVRTDIDAIIVERETGVMGLFQLKWQDSFSRSMSERQSRSRNLMKEATKWIDEIDKLLSEAVPKAVAARLGLPPAVANLVTDAKIFVLARNAVRFSGVRYDARAAWCSWLELVRQTHSAARKGNAVLGRIWTELQKPPPAREVNTIDRLTVDGIQVSIRFKPNTQF